MKNRVLLIGATTMAQDYIQVLKKMNCDFVVVSKGVENAKECMMKTGQHVITGGIDNFLSTNKINFSHAIVAAGISSLFEIAVSLIQHNIKNILIEKPGALHENQLIELDIIATEFNANVLIGYNRRFYKSTQKALEIINNDGGVLSCNFEFTEWSHIIKQLNSSNKIKENWFLANSTHVVDLAFYISGFPEDISCYNLGKLDWHSSASIFYGAGKTSKNVLFSYQANWQAPGRWSLEFLTKKSRLIFKPLEKLQIQKIGSVDVKFIEIDYKIDEDFKPGLYNQVLSFINNDFKTHCLLTDQIKMFKIYSKIANY